MANSRQKLIQLATSIVENPQLGHDMAMYMEMIEHSDVRQHREMRAHVTALFNLMQTLRNTR